MGTGPGPSREEVREGRLGWVRPRGQAGVAFQALRALAGERPPCSSPHFIPHLVVHGDALPVLKVAAVGTGRSRACPRCHYPRPEPQSPSRRPTTVPSCLHTPITPPRLATLTAAQFGEANFRPLCLRPLCLGRTNSVVTPSRTRTCTLSRPGLPLSVWSAQEINPSQEINP